MSQPPSPRSDATSPPGVAYLDGHFLPIAEARIPVLDWGFLRSDATYDVVHVWRRRFFRLDRHVERFERSLARLRLSLPWGRARLIEILKECVRRSALDDAYVEMICTRGQSPGFSRDPRDALNRFIAFAIPFGRIADARQQREGLSLAVSDIIRIPPGSVDPRIKNYHWLDLIGGLFEAYDKGAETVVLRDHRGDIAEGPGFNLFARREGAVVTPAEGVLEGITRATALELLGELGVPATPGRLAPADLRTAEEVFITSTAGGIMPVTRVDGRAIGDGRPGALTRRLSELYWAKHDDPAWTTPVD